jgi:RNA polymerase sigma factor (sigma-70 family)
MTDKQSVLASRLPVLTAGEVERRLFREHSVLRRYIARRIRNPQDADDYVQEVYLRVLSARPANKIENLRGFLLRIASNLIVDRLRRDATRQRDLHVSLEDANHPDDGGAASPERILLAREQLERLGDVLQGLDPTAAAVFRLVRLEGRPHREVARKLGIEVKSVSRHMERVLVKLARAVET